MFGLSGFDAAKAIGAGILIVLIGGYIGFLKYENAVQAKTISDQRVQVITCTSANEDFKTKLDAATNDAAAFKKQAEAVAKQLSETEATVITKTQTIIKRVKDNATPADNAYVSPAFDTMFDSVRQ